MITEIHRQVFECLCNACLSIRDLLEIDPSAREAADDLCDWGLAVALPDDRSHEYSATPCAIELYSSNTLEDVIDIIRADRERGERGDDGLSDVEADAMTLASAGMGTDKDYGCYDGGGCDDY